MDLTALAVTFGTIFLVELPDKTFIATLVLSTRYRPWAVWVGVGLAFGVQTLLAVTVGALATLLPDTVVRAASTLIFLVGAVVLFRTAPSADAAEKEQEEEFSAKAAENRTGLRAVAASFLVLFTAYGAQYSFGVFFAALLDEFGWSRAGLAGVFSLYAFAYSVFAFPAGRLTDRWGPRAVITAGGVFLGVALAAMATVSALWQPYVLYGVVAAIGMGTAYVPCSGTVVKWFARRRGLAVGLAGSGGSVGTFVLPPFAQWLVSAIQEN